MNFDLPNITTEQPPAFITAANCQVWLDKQPPASDVQTQAMLLRQLNLLNRYRLPAAERLAIMECLRQAVHSTQEENVRRFSGKTLPLTPADQAALDTCLAIWNALAMGYLHCVAACIANDATVTAQWPLAAQRALAALLSAHFDACRGGHMAPAGHWRKFHGTYAAAEQAGVANQEVSDEPRLGRNMTTPAATWVEGLLLAAASLFDTPPRQKTWVARWALRWSGKVGIVTIPSTEAARIVPLCVDLESDAAAGYAVLAGPTVRFLDTSSVRKSLKKRVVMLENGTSPKELQLGDDCTQPQCQQRLIHIYYRWCKGGAPRANERRAASGTCTLIGNLEAIHYYLSGRQPLRESEGRALTDTQIRQQREEIATFGRVMQEHKPANYSEQQGYQIEQWDVLEEWHLIDQSATGLNISRPQANAGGRFGGGQLVAAKPADAKALMLGVVRWAMIDAGGLLQAGIEVIAGKPQPVGLRAMDVTAAAQKLVQGFLMPAVPALKQPDSVIMPPGWFRREREIEIQTAPEANGVSRIKLTGIVDRGGDFERATYEEL